MSAAQASSNEKRVRTAFSVEALRTETALRFDRWLEPAKGWLSKRGYETLPFSPVYPSEGLVRRLMQQIIDLTFDPYSRAKAAEYQNNFLPDVDDSFTSFAEVKISRSSGRVKLSPKRIARDAVTSFAVFMFVFLKTFTSGVQSWFRSPRGSAGLMTNLGHHVQAGGSDARFACFARKGPLGALNLCRRLIVQSTSDIVSTEPERLSYAKIPFFELLKDNRVPFWKLLWLLIDQVFQALRFFVLVILRPEFVLLGRDYAFLSLVRFLDQYHLIEALFLTDGNSSAQFLYMGELPKRTFQVHFIWHSQNVRSIVMDEDERQWDYALRRYMKMDHAWCWTSEFADWMNSQGIKANVHVVGPLVFHLPEKTLLDRPDSSFRLCVFDVTAISQVYLDKTGQGWGYYNAQNCGDFLSDVVAVGGQVSKRIGRPFRVFLKHKRSFSWVHDASYIQRVHEMQEKGMLEVVSPDSNMFDLVSSCDAVVSMPFTSAALVAKHQKVPAYFYDPTKHVWAPDALHTSQVPLLRGTSELLAAFERAAASPIKQSTNLPV